MNRILILFAHPALQKSRINRVLISAVQDIEAVTFHDLYEAYPKFDNLVPEEQVLLEAHDIIILQHPFFWYSIPATLTAYRPPFWILIPIMWPCSDSLESKCSMATPPLPICSRPPGPGKPAC
ncbi:MAG: NAD(P)H-dependent oxidoreductase [Gemmatimonadota bacterium]|nr:NAD(P)H-dependent oxidoreductase [Gemmatimonadota bacterium]